MALLPKKREERTFAGLPDLRREMDRLFEDFFRGFDLLPFGQRWEAWGPPVDVKENDDTVTVEAELPGIEPDDVDLSVTGTDLTLKGERKEEREEKGKTFHRIERRTGAFTRTIPLPAQVNPERVEATYDKGVLRVVLPKKESARAKSVKIKVK